MKSSNIAFVFTLTCQGAIVLILTFMQLGFWKCTPVVLAAIVLLTFLGAVGTIACALSE